MGIETQAERVRDDLDDLLGDGLYAVGWYDSDQEPRTEAVFMNEEFAESVSPGADEHTVLDDALLGRFGVESHEMMDEDRVASVNIYETFLDLHIHLDDYRGMVIAVSKERDARLTTVISTVEAALSDDLRLLAD